MLKQLALAALPLPLSAARAAIRFQIMAGKNGGVRPGAGRKPAKVIHQLILRETQPGRFEQIANATDEDLTPLAVMAENMRFFHRKAGELMAVILSLPTLTRDEATDAQVQALKDMAGLLKMREMAQMCARDLARYTTPPHGAKALHGGSTGRQSL